MGLRRLPNNSRPLHEASRARNLQSDRLFYWCNQPRASYAHGVVAITLFPGDSALLLLLLVVGAFMIVGMITDGLFIGVALGMS